MNTEFNLTKIQISLDFDRENMHFILHEYFLRSKSLESREGLSNRQISRGVFKFNSIGFDVQKL